MIFEKVEEFLAGARSDEQRHHALGKALEKLRADAGTALVMAEELFATIVHAIAVDEETDVRYLGELEMIDAYGEKLAGTPST